jgi:hypothetical protein
VRLVLGAFALAFCAAAPAQTMYKCKNASGRITYAAQECKELGLTDAGEIRGDINISPAMKTPPAAKAAPRAPAPVAETPSAEPEAAAEPKRRCFTVKTAKGFATRCNDDPEEKRD